MPRKTVEHYIYKWLMRSRGEIGYDYATGLPKEYHRRFFYWSSDWYLIYSAAYIAANVEKECGYSYREIKQEASNIIARKKTEDLIS